MGVGTGGDGRLDLDELGSVIGEAGRADSTETLEDGVGRPSVSERLEDAGVLPWLRAHRPLVASLAVAACVGLVALAVHQANQPPPFDPRVVAAVEPVPVPERIIETAGGSWIADSDLVLARAVVSGVPTGDTVAVSGIVGPGLGASRGTAIRAASDGAEPAAVVWSAAATIDCASPRALSAEPEDFELALTRTDRWGRTSRSTVPLPDVSAAWADQVRRTCWTRAVRDGVTVGDLTARTDLARGTVTLGLVLANSAPLDLVAGSQPQQQDDRGVRVGQSFRVGLAAGLGAQTEVLMSVTSCADVAPPLVGVPQSAEPAGGAVALLPGIPLYVASPDRRFTTEVPLVLDAAQLDLVQRALDSVCAGAPEVDVRPVGAPVVQALGGPSDERQMRISLDVGLSSGRVTEVEVQGDAGLPTVFSARTVPSGPGPVEVVWRYACANTPAPPSVSVTTTDGSRTWPWRGLLDDEVIARAVLRGCSVQTAEALAGAGWPSRLLVRG